MKVSTKGRYALRMLLYLAEHKDEGFISLKKIAESENISKQYLEQIVSLLISSGILRANRGKQGGYMLAREASDYTVGQLLLITERSLTPVSCLEDELNQCSRSRFCKTLPVWEGLGRVVYDYLNGITLQDILEQHKEKGSCDYVI
ncbi:MAG: Rrf2 family transcriptional regulator [Oscillospiraceae bacterium]|nr:Rrf2 family transcriptional regulator [Oscillospiraceae bacterium]